MSAALPVRYGQVSPTGIPHRHARPSRRSSPRAYDAAEARASISRSISPISKPPACSCASTARSTRTPSCIRWCAGNSSAACRKTSAALSCSPMSPIPRAANTTCRWWSARWRRRRAFTRSAWARRSRRSAKPGCGDRHPIPPVAVTSAPCQEVVITGDDLKAPGGLAALPVPVSTPGFDSAPYLTATLCVTRDPDSGIQNMGTYRAALKATDRLAVRMVAREATGAGGYLHWLKYRKRRRSRCRSPSSSARRPWWCSPARRSSPSISTRWRSPAGSPASRSRRA